MPGPKGEECRKCYYYEEVDEKIRPPGTLYGVCRRDSPQVLVVQTVKSYTMKCRTDFQGIVDTDGKLTNEMQVMGVHYSQWPIVSPQRWCGRFDFATQQQMDERAEADKKRADSGFQLNQLEEF